MIQVKNLRLMTKLRLNYLVLLAALGVNLACRAAEAAAVTDPLLASASAPDVPKPLHTGKYVPRFRKQSVAPTAVPAEFLLPADLNSPLTTTPVVKLNAVTGHLLSAVTGNQSTVRPLATSNADSIAPEWELGPTPSEQDLATPFSPESSRDSVKFTPSAGDCGQFVPLRSPSFSRSKPLTAVVVDSLTLASAAATDAMATRPSAQPRLKTKSAVLKRPVPSLAQLYRDRDLATVCRALDQAQTKASTATHRLLAEYPAASDERCAISIEIRALGQSIRTAYETPAAAHQRRTQNAQLAAARDRQMNRLQQRLCAAAPVTLAAALAVVKERYDLD